MKRHDPKSFEEAVNFDNELRSRTTSPIRQTLRGRPYLHIARRPLATVVAELERAGDTLGGRIAEHYNPFNNECEGLSGV